jgi:7-carboxy-7-deazaguanine synthase (Cx14CxxC type)
VYSFKEVFLTLQGEGGQAGRVSVFARFSGCNLWSGRESDRASAACTFCDTDFVGTNGENGGKFASASDFVDWMNKIWGNGRDSERAVVFTGGEPLLQLDTPLIEAVKSAGYFIAVETNGTIPAPQGIDWICVSPKGSTELKQVSGQEMKLVWPQAGLNPNAYLGLDFERFYLQPMDGNDLQANTRDVVDYCLKHPRWRMSVQTHKLVGLK